MIAYVSLLKIAEQIELSNNIIRVGRPDIVLKNLPNTSQFSTRKFWTCFAIVREYADFK